ncbi:helix-turn-helix domain-containing protein [Aeromonas salmonicida]|uniref:helix-turn-helix domain-containing protein n=1 Tax=Aeromonas salmonicida TaxID=645 RepID=UPI001F423BB7|nr:helix-turn-helix domain-containing protein [Aeromonas salmonicida]MCE9935510.1 helix-turn-helix domain-containing protein [Aeromonas salmonicida]
MRIEDVEKFFGNAAKASEAIGIGRCNFTKWKKLNKGIVPPSHAIQFVLASNGELRLGLEDYSLSKTQDQAA